MRHKRPALVCGVAATVLAATVVAQDQGVQTVIGNVFLQNTTPGTAQAGHANVTGTIRAGQLFATSTNTTVPVIGNNTSISAGTIGGSFSAAASDGTALRGTATYSNGGGIGVKGVSKASAGYGVFGECTSQFGRGVMGTGTYGVFGAGADTGVYGTSAGAHNNGAGVWGNSFNPSIPGIVGENTASSGIAGQFYGGVNVVAFSGVRTFRDVNGLAATTLCPTGTGAKLELFPFTTQRSLTLQSATDGSTALYLRGTNGTLHTSCVVNTLDQGVVTADVKNFVVPNPDNVSEDIVYACVEGPEAAMYDRGTVRLVNGRAHVSLPHHFSVLAAALGVTVTLTPGSATSKGLAWEHKSSSGFDIVELGAGHGDYDVDWEVKAVRKGYEDYRPVRPWTEHVPEGDDRAKIFAARVEAAMKRRGP